jgi:hypothetical protein
MSEAPLPPGTTAQQITQMYERQNREIRDFVEGKFGQYPDSVLTMASSIYDTGYDQAQWWRTTDGGTIELNRTFRNKSDESPTDWNINIWGPDVEGFSPALRAYLSHSDGSSRPAGGLTLPEYPDGAFDDHIDDAFGLLQEIIADEPMPAGEALNLIEHRRQVRHLLNQEMQPFLGGSQSDFQKFRRNYDQRRTAAINGTAGTAEKLQPVEQDLSVVQIPLAETIRDVPQVAGLGSGKQVRRILALMRANAGEEGAYLLSWNGSGVPHGAVVDGRVIAGMQHGQVVDADGSFIGTYEQVVDPGSSNRRNQVLVFIPPKR